MILRRLTLALGLLLASGIGPAKAQKYCVFAAGNPLACAMQVDQSTGAVSVGLLNIIKAPSISLLPIGNPATTLTSLAYQTTTASTTTREYGVALGMNNNQRSTLGSPNSDAATLFVGMSMAVGGGNSWAINAEAINTTTYGMALSAELDIESNHNTDPTLGAGGINFPNIPNSTSYPYSYGEVLAGASNHTVTAASIVSGGAGGFLRGYTCNNTVVNSCFADYTNSAIAVDIWGLHATAGIDMTNMSLSTPYLLKSPHLNLYPDGNISIDSPIDSALKFSASGVLQWLWQPVNSDATDRIRLYDVVNSRELMTFLHNGKVGIQETIPLDFLTVGGSIGLDDPSGTVDIATYVFRSVSVAKWNLQQINSDASNRLRVYDAANARELASFFHAGGIQFPAGVAGVEIGSPPGGIPGAGALAVAGATTHYGATSIISASFGLSGNISAAAWTTAGVRYKNAAATLTDTTSSGTVATAYTDVWGGNTIAASSATTFTNYYGAYFKAPVAGTNVTFTNGYALGADSLYVAGSTTLSGGISLVVAATLAAQAGTLCGSTVTGGNTTIDTTLACLSSPEDLKNIAGPFSGADALAETMRLSPIVYQWKPGTPKFKGDPGDHIGLGAYATAYADERLIARDAKGNPRGWREDAMIALLVATVQEQQREIAALKTRLH